MFRDGVLVVALAEPMDIHVVDELYFWTKCRSLEVVAAERDAIRARLVAWYAPVRITS